MTYTTRVQKLEGADCTVFMVKVRLSPEYQGQPNDRTVHAMTEEGAAMEALFAAYGETPDEEKWPGGDQHPEGLVETLGGAVETAVADSEPDTSLADPSIPEATEEAPVVLGGVNAAQEG